VQDGDDGSRASRRAIVDDQPIFDRINKLSHLEEELWQRASSGHGLEAGDQERLDKIAVELDQCYDLLHQREARRAAGLDPGGARPRAEEVVERYQQ
jgi:uncharacterized protein DUF2630